MNLSKLNKSQIEAVKHIDGPMLVLAGAGSGKTSVLTNRIAYLIENDINPDNILAITFTNKAAKEMKERTIKIVGSCAYDVQISTFHSFGLKLLKEFYNYLGYSKNFIILDSDDTLTTIKKIIKELGLNSEFYNVKVIRNKISSYKNNLFSLNQIDSIEYDKNIVSIYKKYMVLLKKNNSMDFDDLLLLPIELLKNNSFILNNIQEKYKYILIDEYQDTNDAQYQLVQLISKKYNNIFVVGDESQSIYSFRNANYKNILNFERDFKNAKTVLLEQNYRSTKTILNAANSVIKNNTERKDKNLWCDNEDGDKIKYKTVDSEIDEANYIGDEINKLISLGNLYDDIAILYRTNAQSRVLEEAMLKKGIPYRVVGSFYFYNRKEIKDLLCYLRLVNNSNDDNSLLRIINVPKRGIGDKTIENLVTVAQEKNISLYEAISTSKELTFKAIIEEIKLLSQNLSLTEMVDLVLNKSGIKKELEMEKTLENDIRLENLSEFKSITKSYEEKYGVISLDDFLNEITLVSDVSEHEDDHNKVTLMTVHAVKGLEFNNVFVAGLEEEIFPHFNAINEGGKSAIEEERRLFYVAITRARKKLYLLNAKKRMLYGQTKSNIPSRFVGEINPQYIDREKVSIVNMVNKIIKSNMYNIGDVSFQSGDRIKHTEYGEGIIINVDKSIITVSFPHPFGIKKLMKNHKSITKV